MASLEEFISTARRLPAPPSLVMNIIRLANSPDASIDEVADIFKTNPSLSARLLKLANSVYYGLRSEVHSVHRATVLLGMKTIRSLAVTVWTHSIADQFQDDTVQELLRSLFLHSAAVGVMGQEMAKILSPDYEDDVFLSGMLHDFGRLVMICEKIQAYENNIVSLKGTDREQVTEAENREFGFSHTDLGAKLTSGWGFPDFLTESIRSHHQINLDIEKAVVPTIVQLADHLANALIENIPPTVRPLEVEPELWAMLNLKTFDEQSQFIDTCEQRIKDLLMSMG